jgi:septum formation protein
MRQPPLVLASSSPYRRELLARLGIPFETLAPEVDETPQTDETPPELVTRLATAKVRAVAGRRSDALIVGSDQVVVYDGVVASKPGNHANAVAQLRAASGKRVTVFTGLVLLNALTERLQCEVVPYSVTFRKLTDTAIESYLRKEQPYDCAGSVKAEGLGVALIERFDGEDPNALIGLPLIRLVRMLEAEGVPVL